MGTIRMDRRLFLKSAGATAGAVAATQVGCLRYFKKGRSSAADTREIPTTCELCPNKCSAIAVVEGGFVRKLNPNPENPKSRDMLCARGNAAIKQVYDPDRLKQPMIRVGARGEGKWKPVSWDEAFDFAAKKLSEVKGKYGPEGIALVLHRGLPGSLLQEPGPGLRVAQPRAPPDPVPGLGQPGLQRHLRHRARASTC